MKISSEMAPKRPQSKTHYSASKDLALPSDAGLLIRLEACSGFHATGNLCRVFNWDRLGAGSAIADFGFQIEVEFQICNLKSAI
jgi:hypothetical protein